MTNDEPHSPSTRVGCIGCARRFVITGSEVTLLEDDVKHCGVCELLLAEVDGNEG
jgi:hypothetical protein